jgi:hypothetical protein
MRFLKNLTHIEVVDVVHEVSQGNMMDVLFVLVKVVIAPVQVIDLEKYLMNIVKIQEKFLKVITVKIIHFLTIVQKVYSIIHSNTAKCLMVTFLLTTEKKSEYISRMKNPANCYMFSVECISSKN